VGELPFGNDLSQNLVQNIIECKYEIPIDVSTEAYDMIFQIF